MIGRNSISKESIYRELPAWSTHLGVLGDAPFDTLNSPETPARPGKKLQSSYATYRDQQPSQNSSDEDLSDKGLIPNDLNDKVVTDQITSENSVSDETMTD